MIVSHTTVLYSSIITSNCQDTCPGNCYLLLFQSPFVSQYVKYKKQLTGRFARFRHLFASSLQVRANCLSARRARVFAEHLLIGDLQKDRNRHVSWRLLFIVMLLANIKGCKKLSRGRFARFRPRDSFLQPLFYTRYYILIARSPSFIQPAFLKPTVIK